MYGWTIYYKFRNERVATFGLETGKEKASLQRDRRMNEKCRDKRGQRVLLVPKNFFILFGSFPMA